MVAPIDPVQEYKTWLNNLKVGDQVDRLLAGVVWMRMTVTKIADGKIYVGKSDELGNPALIWSFSPISGGEIDEELGWLDGGINTPTGSQIFPVKEGRKIANRK